jgi:hypothetical protein
MGSSTLTTEEHRGSTEVEMVVCSLCSSVASVVKKLIRLSHFIVFSGLLLAIMLINSFAFH